METNATYYYEPAKGHGLAHDPFNAIVGPRPIGWVATKGRDGSTNLAPYSFFNAFNYQPPIVGFASVGAKDSLRNAQETREFTWNIATRPIAEAMNQTCAPLPYGSNEFTRANLAEAPSNLIAAPRVAISPVNFECKVTQIIQLQTAAHTPVETWLVLGEVVAIHINESLLTNGTFDTFNAQIILRAGGPSAYAEIRPDARFDMARPSK
jgi:flavin reductase (DIM6/NTAB) family NADH-FMN oxidoreductase RutF